MYNVWPSHVLSLSLQNPDFYNLWTRITWPSSRGSVLFPPLHLFNGAQKNVWKEFFLTLAKYSHTIICSINGGIGLFIKVYAVILWEFKLKPLLAPAINYPPAKKKKKLPSCRFYLDVLTHHYPECLACTSLVLSVLHLRGTACCEELLVLAGTQCLCQ